MFEIVSILLRYLFILVIYLFIYGIIRLIYLDIQTMNNRHRDPAGEMPYLKLINRRDSLDFRLEEVYLLDGDKTIGRSNKNSIVIQDPFISSEHIQLILQENGFCLKDLGSKNGTFVNGEPVAGQQVLLKNGDRVHIGQLDLLYVTGT